MSTSRNHSDWKNWLRMNVGHFNECKTYLVYHPNTDHGYYFANESNVKEKLNHQEWEQLISEPVTDDSNALPEHTGLSVSYYDVVIPANSHTNPEHNQPVPVVVSCNDIIELLNMNYACANVFKAIWRICAAKLGKKKKGNNTVYDAEKVLFFGERVLKQEQKNGE